MTNDARGARIGDLRRLLAVTQSDLADLTGIPQPNLSAIERGRATLTDAVAHRISQATGTPLEFFNFHVPSYGDTEINFRKSKRVSARGRDFVLQAFKEIERISRGLSESPTRLRRNHLAVAEAADIVTDDDIDALSMDARLESGFSATDPIRNVIRTVERAGIAVASLAIPEGVDNLSLLDGHCGISRWEHDCQQANIAYVVGLSGDRLRFTIAHELGHILLHTRREVTDVETREREANLFAGSFLVPKPVAMKSISETLTLHGFMRLKAQFGIAIQALIMRGRNAGLISQQRQRSLMIQISSRGWRTNEPVKVGCETPALLWTQLAAQLGNDRPYLAASRTYGIAPALLSQWIPPRGATPRSSPPAGEPTATNVVALRPSTRP